MYLFWQIIAKRDHLYTNRAFGCVENISSDLREPNIVAHQSGKGYMVISNLPGSEHPIKFTTTVGQTVQCSENVQKPQKLILLSPVSVLSLYTQIQMYSNVPDSWTKTECISYQLYQFFKNYT